MAIVVVRIINKKKLTRGKMRHALGTWSDEGNEREVGVSFISVGERKRHNEKRGAVRKYYFFVQKQ